MGEWEIIYKPEILYFERGRYYTRPQAKDRVIVKARNKREALSKFYAINLDQYENVEVISCLRLN